MLLFYFQTNKQKISSLQVVLKEELHTDTLPGQAKSPLVEQEAHPAKNSLCLCACRRHTEELPGQSDKVRILLPSAPPPTKRIKVLSQSRLVSVPARMIKWRNNTISELLCHIRRKTQKKTIILSQNMI